MSDVSAGRLHLDATADTGGFGRETKRKVDAEIKAVRARIKAELDTRGMVSQARKAAKAAGEAATVRLRAEVDTRGTIAAARAAAKAAGEAARIRLRVEIDQRGLIASTRATAAAASAAARVKVKADIDQAQFERSLKAAVKAMKGKYTVTVGVEVDTGAALAHLEAFRQAQRARPIDLGIRLPNFNSNLARSLTQIGKMPAMVGGIYALVGALTQVAGGLFAITSAASQAVVTLAALPNLVGAIGQAGAVLLAGFSGVSDGVKALGEAEKAGAQQSQKAAAIRDDSARRVADAQRNLAEAYHAAEDAARQARYAVSDAEWSLMKANEASTAAQTRLNRARAEAVENLRELQETLDRSALSEDQAIAALSRAQAALQDTLWDASRTPQEAVDAQLAVREAEQTLRDVQTQQEETAAAIATAQRQGVDGAEDVVEAQRDVRDAAHSVAIAERSLQEARHDAADTARQNAASIAQAQQAIIDAQNSGAEAMAAQTAAMADQTSEFDKLTPAAQRFAQFWFDTVMPRFARLRDAIQEAILPPIQRGITAAMPFVDTLQEGLLGTADVVGRLTERVGALFGSDGFNANTASIMSSNNRVLESLGGVLYNLIEFFSELAVAAGPTLAEPFARWLELVTAGWAETAKVGNETGTMTTRFERAAEVAAQLGDIIGNVAGALHGMGGAAVPSGQSLLDSVERATQRWEAWANSEAGEERMRTFFAATEEVTREFFNLLGAFGEFLAKASEAGAAPITVFLQTLTIALEGLTAAFEHPVIGQMLAWFLTLAGLGGGLAVIAGVVLKLGGAVVFLSRITGFTWMLRLIGSTAAWGHLSGAIYIARTAALSWIRTQAAAAAAAVRTRVATIASTIATRAAAVATRAWAIATGLLNAAMRLNPLGLLLTALLAIGAGLVWAYFKFEGFRKVVDKVVGAVVDACLWLWDVLFGHSVFPDIVDGIKWAGDMIAKAFDLMMVGIRLLAKVFTWLWDNAVKPTWSAMRAGASVAGAALGAIFSGIGVALRVLGAVFGWLWENAVQPAWAAIQVGIQVAGALLGKIFGGIGTALRVLGAVFGWLYAKIIKPVWSGVQVYVKAVSIVLGAIFGGIGTALRVLGDVFSWLKRSIVDPIMNGIKSTIETVWTRGIKPVFDALISIVEVAIVGAFQTAKDGIARIWDGLKAIASAPVEFIVNTVYNDGIRKVINAIPGIDDLPEVNFPGFRTGGVLGGARGGPAASGPSQAFARGGVTPGYTPGRDVHRYTSPTGGNLALSGGEGIMVPQWVRRIGGERAVEMMNGAARRGRAALQAAMARLVGNLGGADGNGGPMPRFAGGGIMPDLSFFLGGVLPLLNASISRHTSGYASKDWAGDLNAPNDFGKPVRAWKDGVVAAMTRMTTSYGNHVRINHPETGENSLYAHLSRFASGLAVGRPVSGGQTIGNVGSTGNSTGPHLHFEADGGLRAAALSDMGGGTFAGASASGSAEADPKWWNLIDYAKGIFSKVSGWFSSLTSGGGWGPMLIDSVKSIGSGVVQWINDKIPNFGLPDNPIPNVFDKGGDWRSGTAGVNLSGKTETVFTNREIVDTTQALADIALGMRRGVVDRPAAAATAAPALVENLTINAKPEDVPVALDDTWHALRRIALGGVHGRALAGAPV